MSVQAVVFWMLSGEVILLASFMWMPVMHGERAFFGVRVEPETYRNEGRRILHRYWLTLVAVNIFLCAICFLVAARFDAPLPSITSWLLASAAAALIIYGSFASSVRPFAVPSTTTRFASSLHTRRLADYTRPWLEAAVALLTVASFVVLAYYYPILPERMPVHWNAAGRPDGWARKSLAIVFFLPALGLYLQGFFVLLKHDLVHAKMLLPAAHTKTFLQGKEALLHINIQLTDWVRASLAMLFGCITLLTVATSIDPLRRFAPVAGVSIWISAALLLGGLFYFIWRGIWINKELEEATGEWYVERPADEEHWRHGGLTYYNPGDPALLVEKLVGMGYTFNMAHPGIYSRLAAITGLPFFVAWALLSF